MVESLDGPVTDAVPDSAVTEEPRMGHNRPEPTWDRWTKKRTFVRALEGTYGELLQSLHDHPRVYSTKDFKWHGGPQSYGKEVINPADVPVCQSIETHLKAFAPLGTNVNHGHMNSAAFYVLKGEGFDIQDGERMEYDAGDMLMVPVGCVHQHYNRSDSGEMIVLIMKAKPLFLFMHMVFQKTVQMPPKDATPEQRLYKPPTDI